MEERPSHYHVLSDIHGFVGAFSSAKAADLVVQKFAPIPFIIQRFETAPGPVDTIWVVLYRDLDSVAFLSNDRAEAERVQGIYNSVDLSYIDSIDYWEHPVDKLTRVASERLELLTSAHGMLAEPVTLEELQAREDADCKRLERLVVGADGPIARLLKESEKITIFDCVTPIAARGNTPSSYYATTGESSPEAACSPEAAGVCE